MKICILLLLAFVYDANSKILPDYIPQCKRKEPEYVKCITSAIEKVKPYLLKGIPEIKVPPYEPLVIPNLTIDRNLEALTIKASMDNMKVYGSSSFKIKNLKIDLNKYSAELSLTLPRIHVTSKYDVSGRLLLIPLAGKGKMEGNFTDCTTFTKGSAVIVEKNGMRVLQVDKLNSKIRIGGGHVRFSDNGSNRLIAEAAAAFFNANPRLVLDIFNPIVEDTADAVIIALANRIFGSIPVSELFPDD